MDTRIVAATNRPSRRWSRRGCSAQICYRLGGVEVHVPPLRTAETTSLSWRITGRHRSMRDLRSDGRSTRCACNEWPGNVRSSNGSSNVPWRWSSRPNRARRPSAAGERRVPDPGPSLLAHRFEHVGCYARLVFERCGHNKRRACGSSTSATTRFRPTRAYEARRGSGQATTGVGSPRAPRRARIDGDG